MSTAPNLQQQFDALRTDFNALRQEIAKVVLGQNAIIDGVISALFVGGHVLLEGPPGVGKTLLGETLARVAGCSLQRISFTPDLMPADVIGTHVVMENAQGRRSFEFREGPLFANLVLADHVNRGTPKTQSAMLEAMEGDSVSVANERFDLPQPFMVLATQNPLEMEGTFPLPEPQLDRFLLKLIVSPPSEEDLEAILDLNTSADEPLLRAVVDSKRILQLRDLIFQVPIAADIRRAAVIWASASNPQSPRAPQGVQRYVRYGVSPRGVQALVLAAKVQAVAHGRDHVTGEDLRRVAPAAFRHRLILNYEGHAENVDPDRLVEEIIGGSPGPQ
jgi:MoxR-like ATPase